MKETTALPSWISMSQVVGVLLKLLLMCVTAREISSLPVLPILGPSEIACSWGASVTIQPFVAAEESKCGPSFATWHVRLDSGQNLKSPVDVYLGDLATTQGPLKLTVNKTASNFFVNKDKQLERFEGMRTKQNPCMQCHPHCKPCSAYLSYSMYKRSRHLAALLGPSLAGPYTAACHKPWQKHEICFSFQDTVSVWCCCNAEPIVCSRAFLCKSAA